METESPLFLAAMARFDALNRLDPNKESFQGTSFPKEYLYALRMSAWLKRLAPQAPEALRLATRSQHIARWKIPRSDYPMDRKGYLQWRMRLNQFHAETASKILHELGLHLEIIKKVEALLLKKHLKHDKDMQVLEDVICLVFLENHFADFSKKYDAEKLFPIIQKTWKKMSEKGHAAALSLELSPEVFQLIKLALKE